MKEPLLRRSALYTPGANPDVLLKAANSLADVLIFDLEDSVAPETKAEARRHVVKALTDPVFQARQVVVRVNGLSTPWCEADIWAIARSRIAGVLFPKINTEQDVRIAERLLRIGGVPRSAELWCMIETPTSILNVAAMGRLAQEKGSRMSTWVLGTNDLVKELRARHMPRRENLLPMLSQTLLAARANGLCVLDGVYNDVKDNAGFEYTCMQGREMGFDGRTLIHPKQIDGCHAAYSPSEAEISDARDVIDAFSLPENVGKGVLKVKGRMVELLHADMARHTLAMADAIRRSANSRQDVEMTPLV